MTVGGDEPKALPDSERVSEVVKLVTKPADEDEMTSQSAAATEPPEPRTTEGLADEIPETSDETSEFELFARFFLQHKA